MEMTDVLILFIFTVKIVLLQLLRPTILVGSNRLFKPTAQIVGIYVGSTFYNVLH